MHVDSRPKAGCFFAVAIFLLLVLTSCVQSPKVVKIGLIAPFEGDQREIGYDAIYAARLAIREFNHAGGIGPYRVALVALDNSGQEELTQAAAQSLVLDPQIIAIVGPWEPSTITVAPQLPPPPFIQMNTPPFEPMSPELLPDSFLESYAGVTPFDETAGPQAGPTYDAFQLIFESMTAAYANEGQIDRKSVELTLQNMTVEGITGDIYWKP